MGRVQTYGWKYGSVGLRVHGVREYGNTDGRSTTGDQTYCSKDNLKVNLRICFSPVVVGATDGGDVQSVGGDAAGLLSAIGRQEGADASLVRLQSRSYN